MRGALAEISGIKNIETDIKASPPLCTFEVTDTKLDITSKLDELAESPESFSRFFKDYTVVN